MGSGYKGGGSKQFQSAFGDMTTANQDSGIGGPVQPKKHIDWDGLMQGMLESAAIAQGGPAAGAQLRSLRKPSIAEQMAQELQLYEGKQQIEQRYAKPANNDTSNDYAFIEQKLGKDAADQYLKNLGDATVTVQLPGNRVYSGPRSGMAAALGGTATPSAHTGGPQPGAIEDGHRFKGGNPADPANWEAMGGAAVPPRLPLGGSFPDPTRAPGTMTSGRRTVEGNRLVGGVPNSHHLTGDAADYSGASMQALQQYFGPNARYLNEGDHVHVTMPGYGRVPYKGRRGTIGAR